MSVKTQKGYISAIKKAEKQEAKAKKNAVKAKASGNKELEKFYKNSAKQAQAVANRQAKLLRDGGGTAVMGADGKWNTGTNARDRKTPGSGY